MPGPSHALLLRGPLAEARRMGALVALGAWVPVSPSPHCREICLGEGDPPSGLRGQHFDFKPASLSPGPWSVMSKDRAMPCRRGFQVPPSDVAAESRRS